MWKAFDRYSNDPQGLQARTALGTAHAAGHLAAQLDAGTRWSRHCPPTFFARVIDSQRAWAKRVSYYVLLNNVDTKLAYEHYFGS